MALTKAIENLAIIWLYSCRPSHLDVNAACGVHERPREVIVAARAHTERLQSRRPAFPEMTAECCSTAFWWMSPLSSRPSASVLIRRQQSSGVGLLQVAGAARRVNNDHCCRISYRMVMFFMPSIY